METVKEILIVYGRIITILPLLLIIALFMGKRSVGEMPVFDFLIVISLGSVVGADIADPEIQHLHTALAIIGIGLLQKTVSKLMIKSRLLGRLITFEPTIVIKNGTFLNNNLKRIKYSADNILQLLREKDIFDVRVVEMAFVEANGNLTVYKKPNQSEVTAEDLGIQKKPGGFFYPVIVDGTMHRSVLQQLDLSAEWLNNQLQLKGITQLDDVFFASVNQNHELHVSLHQETSKMKPELLH
ncbi:DUF421 domain-containing protein [Bacillus sp. WMMC1349]|uniref:DUF421 domain-containing protein n=1 Tax=Bacillus sp. WMMC1349 TaxID=2736254 RepID=UPI001555CB20|nr:DUF421 domain-containing protein [Bacillus sp. WMMC1349]NPC91405.1 DUF421 domain-containing protein [Bacillus sp. WMMC1349]